MKAQEALVWTSYYDGPIDGNAGPGTQSAIRRFQHDTGKAESGTLDDAQSTALFQRAQKPIQASGFRQLLDPQTGIRVGIPFAITEKRTNIASGTDYLATDGRVQIGLRLLKTDQDLGSIFAQLKQRLVSSTLLSYSTVRSNWFVLAGENESTKYYMRYYLDHDLISGFVSIFDKTLPKELTGPLVSAITVMSLTMQPFASEINRASVSRLTEIRLLEPPELRLMGSNVAASDQSDIIPKPIPADTPAARDNVSRDQANGDFIRSLQKKISELESNQRRLEQELASKKIAPTVTGPPPIVAASDSKGDAAWSHQLLFGVLAAVLILMLLMRRRSATPASTATASSNEAVVAPAAVSAVPAVRPTSTETGSAPPATTGATVAQARRASNSGATGFIVAIGGMAAVVFFVAFVVQQLSSFAGF